MCVSVRREGLGRPHAMCVRCACAGAQHMMHDGDSDTRRDAQRQPLGGRGCDVPTTVPAPCSQSCASRSQTLRRDSVLLPTPRRVSGCCAAHTKRRWCDAVDDAVVIDVLMKRAGESETNGLRKTEVRREGSFQREGGRLGGREGGREGGRGGRGGGHTHLGGFWTNIAVGVGMETRSTHIRCTNCAHHQSSRTTRTMRCLLSMEQNGHTHARTHTATHTV